ncbi:unnamed protein product, partial [Amoebophrya sp. A25]
LAPLVANDTSFRTGMGMLGIDPGTNSNSNTRMLSNNRTSKKFCVVVSPLISLMQDQVTALEKLAVEQEDEENLAVVDLEKENAVEHSLPTPQPLRACLLGS